GGDFAHHHLAGGAINGKHIVMLESLPTHLDLAALLVNLDFAGTCHTATAPTTGNHRRMARHPTGAGQNTSGNVHAVDVFWVSFFTYQQNLFASLRSLDSFGGS